MSPVLHFHNLLLCLLVSSELILVSVSTVAENSTTTTTFTTDSINTTTTISSSSSVTTTITTTPPPYPITSSFIWTEEECLEYPEVVVSAQEGYSITLNVSGIALEDGSYVFVESGDHHVPGATDGRAFVNKVQGPLQYLFPSSLVYARCKIGDASVFTLEFKRAGELPTSTSTTTTTENTWPTTNKGDSAYVTVNVSGRSVEEYGQSATLGAFKTCVARMAQRYCQNVNIHLRKNITEENVQIMDIVQCPFLWPDHEHCVRITFKLPIFYDESDTWDGYQINARHLEIMWVRDANDECFRDNHFYDYTEPNFDSYITWWAVGISVVIALFIIVLWFLKTFSAQLRSTFRKRYRRASDTSTIISSKKDSLISLTPHYLQDHMDTPKFFET